MLLPQLSLSTSVPVDSGPNTDDASHRIEPHDNTVQPQGARRQGEGTEAQTGCHLWKDTQVVSDSHRLLCESKPGSHRRHLETNGGVRETAHREQPLRLEWYATVTY